MGLQFMCTVKVTGSIAYEPCQTVNKVIKHDGMVDAGRETAYTEKKEHAHLIYSSFPGLSSVNTPAPAGPACVRH